MDADKLIKQLRKDAVPIPSTEHAVGYNKGIEHAIKLLEELKNEIPDKRRYSNIVNKT